MAWMVKGARPVGLGIVGLCVLLSSAAADAQQPAPPPPSTTAAPPPSFPNAPGALPPGAPQPGAPQPGAPQPGAPLPGAAGPWTPPPIAPAPYPNGYAPAPGGYAPAPGAYPAPGGYAPAPGYGPAPTLDPNATWGAPGQPLPVYSPPSGGTSFDNPYFLVNPVQRVPYDARMMYGGIAGTVGGVALILIGSIVLATARDRIDVYCDGPRLCGHLDDLPMKNAGLVMLIGGAIGGAAGVPLWIIGSRKVVAPKKDERAPGAPAAPRASTAPTLRVMGAGAALRWEF